MSTQPQQTSPPPQRSLFEAVKQGDKKKATLLPALRNTHIDRANVAEFIAVMNDLPATLAAELIATIWADLDVECRLRIIREWLDRKEREQQAAGYHALSARLLVLDPERSTDLLDHVARLASGSPVCLRRVISITRSEWVGATPEQARFRGLDPTLLKTNGRLSIFDWLADCCPAEIQPSDNDRRRVELQKQSQARASLVAGWLEELQTRTLPESLAAAVSRSLAKLRPKPAPAPSPTPPNPPSAESTKGSSEVPGAANAAPATTTSPVVPQREPETRKTPQDADHLLREMYDGITRLFNKEAERYRKELRSADNELSTARAALERSERDAAAFRAANAQAVDRISELEQHVRAQRDVQARLQKELADASEREASLTSQVETERKQRQASRDEAHDAVSRETQRERDRLLAQLGQRLGNIVESYREIRARGPLPEGAPTMLGQMMDELLSRLEAAGVRLKRE